MRLSVMKMIKCVRVVVVKFGSGCVIFLIFVLLLLLFVLLLMLLKKKKNVIITAMHKSPWSLELCL
jgi:hypothetical protein